MSWGGASTHRFAVLMLSTGTFVLACVKQHGPSVEGFVDEGNSTVAGLLQAVNP